MIRTIGPLVIAVFCILALGIAATTMDAAIDTEPDEVINTELFASLSTNPTVADVRETIEDHRDSSSQQEAEDKESEQDSGAADQRSSQTDMGAEEDGPSTLHERLTDEDSFSIFALIRQLLRMIVAFLLFISPYLIMLTGIALILAKRDRLLELWQQANESISTRAVSDRKTPVAVPENEIDRSWLEMITELNLDTHPAKTPREYATDAIHMGGDPHAVNRLTAIYEEVRYSDTAITEAHINRARQEIHRLRPRSKGLT